MSSPPDSGTLIQPVVAQAPASERSESAAARSSALRRFQLVLVVSVVTAGLIYFWVAWDLWSGSINPLRTIAPVHTAYDLQARAILHGRLTLPTGSIGTEAFVHHGNTYTYFGIFPSILRMPVLLATHALDGRLTALSLSAAWVTTAVFSALLLWRARTLLRGDAPLGWGEAASYGSLILAILAGSVVLFLGSQPDVYTEDLSWSIALATASLFALVGMVERPSIARAIACGVAILCTNLNRATTGYACVIAALLLAAWYALGRGGPEQRRWAIPMLVAGAVPLLAGSVIDYAKFGLFFGVPSSEQELFKEFQFSQLNGGHYFGLRYLPSTLQAYVSPTNFRFTTVFPYITLPDNPGHAIAHTQLFTRAPTAAVLPSMPLLTVAGIWGVVATFVRQQRASVRALRLLLVSAALSAGAVMVFGWILERFVADFMPLLILASILGTIDIWRHLDGRRRGARTLATLLIAGLALFGLVTNVGFAVEPDATWTQTQAAHFVRAQLELSNVTGHPLFQDVVRGSSFPSRASAGQLFIKGDCEELFVADQAPPRGFYYTNSYWIPVERTPRAPLCHDLLGAARSIAQETQVVIPANGSTVSGSAVILGAFASGPGRVTSVSFLLSGGSLAVPIGIGRATDDRGVWTTVWNSNSEPDGTYSLRSVTITSSESTVSPPIRITVHNRST